MTRRLLLLGLLGLSLGAPAAYAQTAPANPVDPASVQALKDMGAQLQALKRFRVTTDLSGERVLGVWAAEGKSLTADDG